MPAEKLKKTRKCYTPSATAQRFSSTIKWAAVAAENYWSAYLGDGLDNGSSNRF